MKILLSNRGIRIVFILSTVLIASFVVLLGNGTISSSFSLIGFYIGLIVISIIFGILFSNVTERFLRRPTETIMNILRGFGCKSTDPQTMEDGIPIVTLRRWGTSHYNPVTVATTALDHYEAWKKTGNKDYFKYFKNCADWLITNLKMRKFNEKTYGVWEYDYNWSYSLVPPWISGLAQGVGAQALGLAYIETKSEKYLKVAKNALATLFIEVKDGGVVHKDNENEWWYEEYAQKGVKPSRALNGHIYAMIGAYRFFQNTGDRQGKFLFEKGLASLRTNLKNYDNGWWSCYDALGTVADESYHRFHINLLKEMYKITHERLFLETYEKWAKYKTGFFKREFIKKKPNWYDKLVLLLNVGGMFVIVKFGTIFWIIIKKTFL